MTNESPRTQLRSFMAADMGTIYVMASLKQTATELVGIKLLIAIIAGLGGLVVGSYDRVVFGVLGLWALDMIMGSVHAFAVGGTGALESAKARAGFLRAVAFICAIAAVALAVDVLAQMGGPSLVPVAVWGVCGWAAVSELASIGRHVDYFYPGILEFFDRVGGHFRPTIEPPPRGPRGPDLQEEIMEAMRQREGHPPPPPPPPSELEGRIRAQELERTRIREGGA